MPKRKMRANEYFSNIAGQLLEGGDPNSQGYAAIVVFAILAALIFLPYFYPPCPPHSLIHTF
jgi:hypothetical protein